MVLEPDTMELDHKGSKSTVELAGYTSLLAGATGLIGRALLKQLIVEPSISKITVLSRRPVAMEGLGRPSELAKVEVIVASLDDMELALEQVKVDMVFCTLGTTIKIAKTKEAFRKVDYEYPLSLAQFAERTDVVVFSVVTAMGASQDSRFFYSRVKGELQDNLAKLSIPHIQVFQPSLLLGERPEARPGEALGAWVSKSLQFAMVGPLRKYRAIKGEAVALAMLFAAFQALGAATSAAGGKASAIQYYPSDKIAELAVHTTG
ncbi:NAD(P)H-binding protein [Paenibacillus luteus]|uniref:NAD(P)H-binding protein n=1 Tax=Paenibacillus luteus TaxID=2545753 RepID=UPI001F501E5A|nr:NAD(P)H-binding protein [Paenibacillus luteus]